MTYTLSVEQQLREHRHMALEAVCVPEQFKWLESKPLRVELDADILRR